MFMYITIYIAVVNDSLVCNVYIPQLSTEVPLDPNALRDLERHAQKVASNLEYIMDNLRNSLHAVGGHCVYIYIPVLLSMVKLFTPSLVPGLSPL